MSALALTLAAVAALQAPTQFNLVCSGLEWNRLVGGRSTPYSATLRVDIDAGRWCSGDCLTGRAIISATPDRIELEKTDPREGSRVRISSGAYIDRINGTYNEHFSMISVSVQAYRREARCAPAPFTGMPQPRF